KGKSASGEEPEAPAEADGAAESAQPKSRFPLKLIVIAVAAIAVLGGGGGAAYFMFGHGGESKAAAAPVKAATFVDVPEVLVNLSNPGSDRTQYLKVKIVLELPDPALTAQVQTAMPRVMD